MKIRYVAKLSRRSIKNIQLPHGKRFCYDSLECQYTQQTAEHLTVLFIIAIFLKYENAWIAPLA